MPRRNRISNHKSHESQGPAPFINPRLYLEDVTRRLMAHPFNRLEELLPDQWLAAKAEAEGSPLVGFR